MLANMRIRGMKDDSPRLQAMERALSSPAYLEYLKEQDAVFPGFKSGTMVGLLGIPRDFHPGRQLQEENFREHFPTGAYADYEPMMRQRLAELFLETVPPEDPTDRREVRRYTLDVMSLFRAEWANKIWMRGYFNGYDGDVAWADTIRQSADSIVAAVPSKETHAADISTATAMPSEASPADVADEPQDARPVQRHEKTLPLKDAGGSSHKTSPTSPENSRNA